MKEDEGISQRTDTNNRPIDTGNSVVMAGGVARQRVGKAGKAGDKRASVIV